MSIFFDDGYSNFDHYLCGVDQGLDKLHVVIYSRDEELHDVRHYYQDIKCSFNWLEGLCEASKMYD